jgi:diguanylate cyclase (GGDEF)-like protein
MTESERNDRRTALGHLAGILFLVGAAASIPANLLFRDPAVGAVNHVLVGLAVVSGLACFLVPWERVPDPAFHLIPSVGAAEIALTTWAAGRHGPVYEWFFVFTAMYAAYAFAERREIGTHLGFISACACLPLVYDGGSADAIARLGVVLPMLWVTTAVVMRLREQMRDRQRELAELARRDPLTGAGNRRHLDDRLDYELARHRRTSRQLSLLVLDLDRFKEVNDTLGHPAGDRVLCDVAEVLRHTVRDGDTVVRHGGDEFCVVAPETGLPDALALGDRIGAALAGLDVLGRPMSASVGVAVFPDDGPSPELLLAAADLSERSAKLGSRGCSPSTASRI